MQSLDVISINIWQMLISLSNLLILFLIFKKFLYKPVKKVINERNAELERRYIEADKAKKRADLYLSEWETKIKSADNRAKIIEEKAVQNANRHSERILSVANEKADCIVKEAQADAEMEYENAAENIKKEIVEISAVLAEKILRREIDEKDCHAITERFIAEMGEEND